MLIPSYRQIDWLGIMMMTFNINLCCKNSQANDKSAVFLQNSSPN